MQIKRTKSDIMNRNFFTKSDIATLFDIGKKRANKIYNLAEEIDNKELGNYRVENTRVRKKSVFKVYGISPKDIVV